MGGRWQEAGGGRRVAGVIDGGDGGNRGGGHDAKRRKVSRTHLLLAKISQVFQDICDIHKYIRNKKTSSNNLFRPEDLPYKHRQIHTVMSKVMAVISTLEAIRIHPSVKIYLTSLATKDIVRKAFPHHFQHLLQSFLHQKQPMLILKLGYAQLQTHPHLLSLFPRTTPLVRLLLVTLLHPTHHLRRQTQGRRWIRMKGNPLI